METPAGGQEKEVIKMAMLIDMNVLEEEKYDSAHDK